MNVDLDRQDRAILALLQQNCRLSSDTIGEAVALSATAVQRRLKRLRDTGAIREEVAHLSAAALGRTTLAVVGVQLLQGSRHDLIEAFKRRMLACPQVQQCYYVAGEFDFVVLVTAIDPADYERLSRELFFDDANIKKFQTSFVLDAVKSGLQLPLSADGPHR